MRSPTHTQATCSHLQPTDSARLGAGPPGDALHGPGSGSAAPGVCSSATIPCGAAAPTTPGTRRSPLCRVPLVCLGGRRHLCCQHRRQGMFASGVRRAHGGSPYHPSLQLLQFANPQKVQEMAMQQMMKQMMSQAGMKPPAGGARYTCCRYTRHTPTITIIIHTQSLWLPSRGLSPSAGGRWRSQPLCRHAWYAHGRLPRHGCAADR